MAGGKKSFAPVIKAGGLQHWRPGKDLPSHLNHVWLWMQAYGKGKRRKPKVYIGYGSSDSNAPPMGLIESAFEGGNIFKAKGGHNWAAFRRIWKQMLERLQGDFRHSR